jgi:hypothetical protein
LAAPGLKLSALQPVRVIAIKDKIILFMAFTFFAYLSNVIQYQGVNMKASAGEYPDGCSYIIASADDIR